jgi:Mg2+ and Co2+ transporter CorA
VFVRGKNTMLPEEKELARYETEQAQLAEEVTSAELALETIKAETAQFQSRYYKAVGRLYAKLDEIDAQIAKARAKQAPSDTVAQLEAQAAEQRARKSAKEAGLEEAKPELAPKITPEVQEAYRRAVKLIHPDLAVTEKDRLRRTELMKQLNLAYERGDLIGIEKIVSEYGEDPDAIVGEDVASRIVKSIRRIAQLRRRLTEIQGEMETLKQSEIFQLRQTIEEQEAIGSDPLGDLAKELTQKISEQQIRLNAMQGPAREKMRDAESGR